MQHLVFTAIVVEPEHDPTVSEPTLSGCPVEQAVAAFNQGSSRVASVFTSSPEDVERPVIGSVPVDFKDGPAIVTATVRSCSVKRTVPGLNQAVWMTARSARIAKRFERLKLVDALARLINCRMRHSRQ